MPEKRRKKIQSCFISMRSYHWNGKEINVIYTGLKRYLYITLHDFCTPLTTLHHSSRSLYITPAQSPWAFPRPCSSPKELASTHCKPSHPERPEYQSHMHIRQTYRQTRWARSMVKEWWGEPISLGSACLRGRHWPTFVAPHPMLVTRMNFLTPFLIAACAVVIVIIQEGKALVTALTAAMRKRVPRDSQWNSCVSPSSPRSSLCCLGRPPRVPARCLPGKTRRHPPPRCLARQPQSELFASAGSFKQRVNVIIYREWEDFTDRQKF